MWQQVLLRVQPYSILSFYFINLRMYQALKQDATATTKDSLYLIVQLFVQVASFFISGFLAKIQLAQLDAINAELPEPLP